ncbi:MAG TPA: alpha/beta fold hydrolase [Acidimicrobiales bacterium]|nr:alpha/beta fold hydrolase [Acidimicrobiales bacterium]
MTAAEPGGSRAARRLARVGTGLAVAATAAAAAYAVQLVAARRWRVDEETLVAAGLTIPADATHHFVATGDGGRLHVVERGEGPPIVLVHGITLGAVTWAPQLHDLSRHHRVVAVDLRGHGPSLAGETGYSFTRMADDLLEVLAALSVERAVLVGHSMGGMITLTAAVERRDELHRHVAGLALVGTTAGPMLPGPGSALGPLFARTARRGLRLAERRGKGAVPQEDVAAWMIRGSFGERPDPADVALAKSMLSAMSPAALAALLEPLLLFDVHDELGAVDFPTAVVVGTRDMLLRPSRLLAAGIPGATLTVLPGCGHMVMLERAEELDDVLTRLSREVAGAG